LHGVQLADGRAMQLFYAESRGLDPASARALLLEGFIMGLWGNVENAAQHDAISTAAKTALRRVV